MGDDSERLHLEGLDEATERERWEEHHAAPTDLPDAVVEAAAEALYRHTFKDMRGWNYADPPENWLQQARVVLAAASGPWAEQVDAAGWRTEAYDARKQIAGLAAERDAALARNAELEGKRSAAREVVTGLVQASESSILAELQKWHAKCDEVGVPHDPDGLVRHHRNNEAATQGAWKLTAQEAIAQNETLRAELDNLRGKLTALADETPWKTTDHLGNVTGYLINADELRAIVRGSDDE